MVVDLAPGTLVAGRFVLDRLLGEGGMGVVWAATHAVTRKAVALKLLKPDKASDPVVRQRFVREARAASAVEHPNIIEIRDVIELEDGAPAMIMDLLEGESLGDRLERERALPLETLAPIMLQVVSAVGTAHAAGVVHRDLKPDNIFLVSEPGGVSVRVLDFGIAKVMPAGSELPTSRGLTNTGAILGTPFYMAPEQIFGERGIDQRADVWAIGIILYECLAGRRPTEAENIGQILRIITNDAIVPLEKVAPSVPDDVADMVGRMLERDRNARPGLLVEAFEILRRYAPAVTAKPFQQPAATSIVEAAVVTGDSSARAVVPSDGDASPTAATLASTTASTTADRIPGLRRKRRRLPFGIALLVGVVAGGATLALLVRSSPSRPAPTAAASPVPPPPSPAQPSAAADPPVASVEPSAVPAPTALASAVATSNRRPPPASPGTRPAPSATVAPPVSSPAPAPTPSALPRPNPYDHM